MKTFFKTYGKYVLFFIGASALFWLWLSRNDYADKYAVEALAHKEKAKSAQQERDRADYYAKENAKLKFHNEQIVENIDIITAESNKYQLDAKIALDKIKLMQKCEDARTALQFELSTCLTKSKTMSDDYVKQFEDFKLNHNEIVLLKNREIDELVAAKMAEVNLRVEAQRKYALKSLQVKRQRAFWLGVGIVAGVVIKSL